MRAVGSAFVTWYCKDCRFLHRARLRIVQRRHGSEHFDYYLVYSASKLGARGMRGRIPDSGKIIVPIKSPRQLSEDELSELRQVFQSRFNAGRVKIYLELNEGWEN